MAKKTKRTNQISELENTTRLGRIPAEDLNGRRFSNSERTYIDYCTTNYLGFDFREELRVRGGEWAKKWGSLTGWSRLEADPVIYPHLEKRITDFLGSGETILAHTITITNFSLIPAIAEKGVIFCDEKVHTVVWEACRLARDHGATLVKFKHQDADDLEEKLKQFTELRPKLIAVDGVYSISTEFAPIRDLQTLAEKYDAWLYVDDAHGFGVLGDLPNGKRPYGVAGKGVIAHQAGNYRRTFYVSSFGKAFCTHTAFATVPTLYRDHLRGKCMQYVFSAPMPPYVIGMAEAALDLNATEGDMARADLLARTRKLVHGLLSLGLKIENNSYFPVVFWDVGDVAALKEVAATMIASGIAAGIRAYPIVPQSECGLRFGVTSLHTDEQIEETLKAVAAAVEGCKEPIKRAG